MFKKIRVTILLYILLFVAVGQYLTLRGATDWDAPLWIDVYLINADGQPATASYLDGLSGGTFEVIADFLAAEAHRFGLVLTQPVRIELAGELDEALPRVPPDGSIPATLWWSLRMRWQTARLHWASDRPTPDITVYLNYHSTTESIAIDRSTALRKAMIAVANVYADRRLTGSNAVVIAHELLHTLGASDKYEAGTNLPLHPAGYAEPARQPLHPQQKAELMAGRIPVSPSEAIVPESLAAVVIGPATAYEIGWIDVLPTAAAAAD